MCHAGVRTRPSVGVVTATVRRRAHATFPVASQPAGADQRQHPDLCVLGCGWQGAFALAGDNEVEVYADISNLFDKKSPLGAVGSPYYDVVGRYFTLGARMRF